MILQDASKLLKEYPDIPHAKKSIVEVFKRMKVNLEKEKANGKSV